MVLASKTVSKHIPPNRPLTLRRQRLGTPGLLSQRHLSITSTDKTREDLAAAVNPLRQLVSQHRVDVLPLVQTLDERRVLRRTAAHVEGPADEGAVLVQVEGRLDHLGDALFELLHVVGEELLAVGLGERDVVLDLGALGLLAEVAVADGGVAGGIRVCREAVVSM